MVGELSRTRMFFVSTARSTLVEKYWNAERRPTSPSAGTEDFRVSFCGSVCCIFVVVVTGPFLTKGVRL
jgi:hypothetical protein